MAHVRYDLKAAITNGVIPSLGHDGSRPTADMAHQKETRQSGFQVTSNVVSLMQLYAFGNPILRLLIP